MKIKLVALSFIIFALAVVGAAEAEKSEGLKPKIIEIHDQYIFDEELQHRVDWHQSNIARL